MSGNFRRQVYLKYSFFNDDSVGVSAAAANPFVAPIYPSVGIREQQPISAGSSHLYQQHQQNTVALEQYIHDLVYVQRNLTEWLKLGEVVDKSRNRRND